MLTEAQSAAQRKLGTTMVRWGAAGLAVPDPLPLVDEILFSAVIAAGAGLYIHGSLSYGSVSSYPSQSHPITSTTGQSLRGQVKKQIRSTSRSHSTRRYYYGKKRKY